jgi:hypothetical protein
VLRRAGRLLAILGPTTAVLWAVAFGLVSGCTEVACPGQLPSYSLAWVEPARALVAVDDGCTVCTVARPVTGGLAAGLVGLAVVAGTGLAARLRGDGRGDDGHRSFRY